jgi:hypothetical protein
LNNPYLGYFFSFAYQYNIDGEFVIDLGRMFIKKTRIIGTVYVETMEVAVFLTQRQTLRKDTHLSQMEILKEVTRMTCESNV